MPGAEWIITCFRMIHFLKKKTLFFSLLLLPVQLQVSALGSRTGIRGLEPDRPNEREFGSSRKSDFDSFSDERRRAIWKQFLCCAWCLGVTTSDIRWKSTIRNLPEIAYYCLSKYFSICIYLPWVANEEILTSKSAPHPFMFIVVPK